MPSLEPVIVKQERKEIRTAAISRFDGKPFPDVTSWSVDKVAEFVDSVGFQEQALALKSEV